MSKQKTSPCDACGSAEGNHTLLWIDGLTDAITLRSPLYRIPFYSSLMWLAERVITFMGTAFFLLGRLIGIIKLSKDSALTVSNRSKLLMEEASRRSIPLYQILFFGSPTDSFYLNHNGVRQFFTSLPLAPEVHALRMDDKVLFKEALRKVNLPVPESYGPSNLKEAREALEAVKVACVKPRTGSNGRHTYPNVRTDEELVQAFNGVKQISPFITVETFLEGNLCRATCVGGNMIGFLESAYPTIIGDGVSTIEKLILSANAQKLDGIDDMKLDDVNLAFVRRRGFEPESVLPSGFSLALTYRGGTGAGGSNREHGRAIHPSFIEPIENAARITELPIVGFDLIIPDPQKSADSQTWGFIESNSLPWIDLHATPYYGDSIDLSKAVWDLWLEKHPTRRRVGN